MMRSIFGRKTVFAALLVVLLLSLVSFAMAGDTNSLADQAQQIAGLIVSDHGATSVQYAMIDNGCIVLSGASGVYSKAENRAITKDSMYGIGSTSKMFVSAAVMVLYDQGLIDIDTPLTAYIPEFVMDDPRYKEITPRMLLNHSSGLYGSTFSNTFLFDDNSTQSHDTLLEKLAGQHLKASPGEMSEYCNDGFTLLELLVEHVSGISYTEFIAQHFSKPLGLFNTKTPHDDFDHQRLVKTYLPYFIGALPTDTVNVLGTGGLYSTAEDLCKFSQVLMGKFPGILSEQATLLMQEEEYKSGIWVDYEGDNLMAFGLGWDTVHSFPFGDYGITALTKGGDTYLFHSSLVVLPQLNIAMAVVSSGGSSSVDCAFASTMLQELLLAKGIINQLTPQRVLTAPEKAEMPVALEAYSGLYINVTSEINIRVKGGILTQSTLDGNVNVDYVYTDDGTFVSKDGSTALQFSLQRDGNIYLQSSQYKVYPGIGHLTATLFLYVKAEPTTIDPDVLATWSERAGKKYYIVSEKSSSQEYFANMGTSTIQLNGSFSDGFARGADLIIDYNSAVNVVKFRDTADLIFHIKNGTEYMEVNDLLYIREDCIPAINSETTSYTIQENGYAQYYAIDTALAGKKMTVTIPDGAAYIVYDQYDLCVNYTTVSKESVTVLPENGKIAFIGDPNDTFTIVFQ